MDKQTRRVLEDKLARLNKVLGILDKIEQYDSLVQFLDNFKSDKSIKLLLEKNPREVEFFVISEEEYFESVRELGGREFLKAMKKDSLD